MEWEELGAFWREPEIAWTDDSRDLVTMAEDVMAGTDREGGVHKCWSPAGEDMRLSRFSGHSWELQSLSGSHLGNRMHTRQGSG